MLNTPNMRNAFVFCVMIKARGSDKEVLMKEIWLLQARPFASFPKCSENSSLEKV